VPRQADQQYRENGNEGHRVPSPSGLLGRLAAYGTEIKFSIVFLNAGRLLCYVSVWPMSKSAECSLSPAASITSNKTLQMGDASTVRIERQDFYQPQTITFSLGVIMFDFIDQSMNDQQPDPVGLAAGQKFFRGRSFVFGQERNVELHRPVPQ